MADRQYTFTASDFSMTSTWNRIKSGSSQGEVVTTSGLTASDDSKTFQITGITLNAGESIKKVILSATLTKFGTIDNAETITVNGLSFNGTRKLDASEISLDSTYRVLFHFRASGKVPETPPSYGTSSYSCTLNVTNLTLTITVGTGSTFDGKVSSLNEGDKILITESSGNISYTLVHHNYNPGKALIFRDSTYGNSKYHDSASYNGYNGSALDTYFTRTFYASLPSSTTQFLQPMDYKIKETAYSSASEITISRTVATISALETGLGGDSGYGSVLAYTDTIGVGAYYWTREPVSGMNNVAKCINSSNALVNQSITSNYGVRPTLGISETQLVRRSDDDAGYVLCSQCTAPSTLYINSSASNVTGLDKGTNLTLSWSAGGAGHNATISGYAVWYSTSANGTYSLYGTTTSTSMVIVAPDKLKQVYYFKVQTLGPDDADFCNSELSSTYRSIATKEGNVYYYDGSKWILADVKYYNGSSWVSVSDVKYYNGSTWK